MEWVWSKTAISAALSLPRISAARSRRCALSWGAAQLCGREAGGDDIVRGTTSRQIVVLLREAGAVQVHLRISAPPFITPCYFGTDWCAPRQVDSEIIYILRMKILPAYHMVLGAMQPVDGHGLP